MCSNDSTTTIIPSPPGTGIRLPASALAYSEVRPVLDQYRLQLYQYAAVAERLRYPFPWPGAPLPCYPLFPRPLQPEEPKPQHSYIGLIAMAILSSPEGKLVLSDIYQHILDNYPYFRSRGPGWRNSIRHNLSLNDCFIKAGRSANGKGHYWAVHPANVDDFRKGDFRRRKAQRKVRRHMGLAVDEEGADSPSPPPSHNLNQNVMQNVLPTTQVVGQSVVQSVAGPSSAPARLSRKRQFDVASLLAPDSAEDSGEEDIDVVSSVHSDIHLNSGSPVTPVTALRPPWPVLPLVTHYYHALLHNNRHPQIPTHPLTPPPQMQQPATVSILDQQELPDL